MAGRWDEEFQEFVAARGGVLHRAAYLLCGDWHEAEDLTQIALARVYRVWRRVRAETAEAYTRRVLVRCFLDSRRRAWRRHEHLGGEVPDVAGRSGDPEGRLVVLAAVDRLPPRQRAVLVLRYWMDLSEDETAAILDCSVGTVKRLGHEGRSRLRALLAASGLQPAEGERS